MDREGGNRQRMRKSWEWISLSISSFSLHFLFISSFSLHFLFISSFSLHFLAARLQGCHNLCKPGQERRLPWKAPHSCDFGATGDYYDGASGGVDIGHDDDDSEDGGDISGLDSEANFQRWAFVCDDDGWNFTINDEYDNEELKLLISGLEIVSFSCLRISFILMFPPNFLKIELMSYLCYIISWPNFK